MDFLKVPRRFFDNAMDRARPLPAGAPLSRDERLEAFRQWGSHSQAYSAATQKNLRYHGDAGGFIAFGAIMGQAVALGDPVCAPERRDDLLRSFVKAAERPSFAEISRPVAEALATSGYRVMHMGFDTRLDLSAYDFTGGSKKALRYADRWLKNNGFRIEEAAETSEIDERLKKLSTEWRERRVVNRREMAFLNRKFPKKPEPLTRRFVLLGPDGEPQSLLFFDPICRGGDVIGYLTAIKRRSADAPAHAEIGLTKHAVDRFKAEGREAVMLGLSPLASMQPSGFAEARLFRGLFEKLYGSKVINARVFNMQGHAAFKRRFHGTEEPRYFAWNGGSPFLAFWALLRLSKAL